MGYVMLSEMLEKHIFYDDVPFTSHYSMYKQGNSTRLLKK